jgi:hypothetical protein
MRTRKAMGKDEAEILSDSVGETVLRWLLLGYR